MDYVAFELNNKTESSDRLLETVSSHFRMRPLCKSVLELVAS